VQDELFRAQNWRACDGHRTSQYKASEGEVNLRYGTFDQRSDIDASTTGKNTANFENAWAATDRLLRLRAAPSAWKVGIYGRH
jgi:hypothetical protein